MYTASSEVKDAAPSTCDQSSWAEVEIYCGAQMSYIFAQLVKFF